MSVVSPRYAWKVWGHLHTVVDRARREGGEPHAHASRACPKPEDVQTNPRNKHSGPKIIKNRPQQFPLSALSMYAWMAFLAFVQRSAMAWPGLAGPRTEDRGPTEVSVRAEMMVKRNNLLHLVITWNTPGCSLCERVCRGSACLNIGPKTGL